MRLVLGMAALALGAMATQAAADEWFVVGQDETAVLLVDRASIQREGSEITLSTMAVPPAGTQKHGISFAYQITWWSVNCDTVAGYMRGQNDFDADGKRVEYGRITIAPRPIPTPFSRDNDLYTAMTAACTGRWGDASPLTTRLAAYRHGLALITGSR